MAWNKGHTMKRTLVVTSLVAFLLAALPATGQLAQPPMSDALVLARLCQSEAGWTCFESGDGVAIHEVLLRGAARRRSGYADFAMLYARRLFGTRPHSIQRLRWSGELNEEATAPSSWPPPPHREWARYRTRWLGVLRRAREVTATFTLDDADEWAVCDGPVHDWGGLSSRARAARIGLVPVQCGVSDTQTRNDFYCRPSDPLCEVCRD